MKFMKKFIDLRTLIALFTILFIFCSCKKDNENDNKKSNSFSYAGNEYETPEINVIKHGVGNSGACLFIIAISSNDLIYDMNDDWFSGTSQHCIYIELYSQSDQEISSGLYTDSDFYNVYTFESDECFLLLNYNFDNDSGIHLEASDGGSINVSKTDGKYTFEYTLTFDGKLLTGYYNGNVQIINEK